MNPSVYDFIQYHLSSYINVYKPPIISAGRDYSDTLIREEITFEEGPLRGSVLYEFDTTDEKVQLTIDFKKDKQFNKVYTFPVHIMSIGSKFKICRIGSFWNEFDYEKAILDFQVKLQLFNISCATEALDKLSEEL